MSLNERVRALNSKPFRKDGRYVLYWIRANRRVEANHALLYAAELANQLDLPLLCLEELDASSPEAGDRRTAFVLEGVPEREKAFKRLGAGYVFHLYDGTLKMSEALKRLAREAAAVVTDDHPTLARPPHLAVACFAVDSSCIVPMALIGKLEYAAYTIRPKIHRYLSRWLEMPPHPRLRRRYQEPSVPSHFSIRESLIPKVVAGTVGIRVAPSLTFSGRRSDALKHLERFLEERLHLFARLRNEPSAHATSDLSPYLHHGLLSPLEVALQVQRHGAERGVTTGEFLEELIVRRELAFNFTRYASSYDTLECLPAWAKKTLLRHRRDRRPQIYSYVQFEAAATHDALWNAAQKELLLRGKIHGYYRMYWGKKIIEWSRSPEEALAVMLRLHKRYALDACGPNTYAGVLWCFGLHDRPWPERPVFGQVRYMSLEGIRRKTDASAYLREIEIMERSGRDPFRIK